MNYKDYQQSRDTAWKILLDSGVDRLPVEISQICRQLGIPVRLYMPADENDGISLIHDGEPLILVSANVPQTRQRFTCAHELGHIILGHVGVYELRNREPAATDNPIEQAANVLRPGSWHQLVFCGAAEPLNRKRSADYVISAASQLVLEPNE